MTMVEVAWAAIGLLGAGMFGLLAVILQFMAKTDARFAGIDARFESLTGDMNARFDSVDARFDALIGRMDARFDAVYERFDAMNGRIDGLNARLDTHLSTGQH